jgi:hypothetical protein
MNIQNRVARQVGRIHAGVVDGTLTRQEAAPLGRQVVKTGHQAARDRIDGDKMTAHERRKSHLGLNDTGKQIFDARRNQ